MAVDALNSGTAPATVSEVRRTLRSLRRATREDLRRPPLGDLASPETGPRTECGFLRGGRTGAIIKSPCNNDFRSRARDLSGLILEDAVDVREPRA
jgi:hypothetical protein